MNRITPTILVIDDNEEFRAGLVDILLDTGYDVFDAPTPHDAFMLLGKEKVDILLCDLDMPFRADEQQDNFRFDPQVGIRTIHELQWVYPDMPIVAMSALPRNSLEGIRSVLSPVPLMEKPFSYSALLDVIKGLGDKPSSKALHQ